MAKVLSRMPKLRLPKCFRRTPEGEDGSDQSVTVVGSDEAFKSIDRTPAEIQCFNSEGLTGLDVEPEEITPKRENKIKEMQEMLEKIETSCSTIEEDMETLRVGTSTLIRENGRLRLRLMSTVPKSPSTKEKKRNFSSGSTVNANANELEELKNKMKVLMSENYLLKAENGDLKLKMDESKNELVGFSTSSPNKEKMIDISLCETMLRSRLGMPRRGNIYDDPVLEFLRKHHNSEVIL